MSDTENTDDQTPRSESVRMPIPYRIVLAMIGSLTTVAIAYCLAPNQHISTAGYVLWIVAPLVLHAMLLMQNTIESCYIVGMILAIPLVALLIQGRFLPVGIVWPALSSVVVPWILTRIHRRCSDGRPWIE